MSPSRVCVLTALTLLVGGCSTTDSATPSAAPAADLPRPDAITWARGIDPCALLDTATFESYGPVDAFGTSSNSTSCEAHADDGASRGLRVSWSIADLPTDFHTAELGSLVDVDGVRVRQVDAASAMTPDLRDQLVESSCGHDIPFENSIAVRMSVSMDPDHDACEVGEALTRKVIDEWPKHPKQGSSPNTTVTVLTAAFPCAVVPVLQESRNVGFDWDDQSLNSCFFTVDGTGVLVSFDHRPDALASPDATPTRFGDRDGFVDQVAATALAVVGTEFDGVVAGSKTRLVPAVEVSGDDSAVNAAVMTAALSQLPG